MNKSDLADEKATSAWVKYFEDKGFKVLLSDALAGKGVNAVTAAAKELMAEKIVEFIGLDYESLNKFESIHNYIEVDKYMLRKGAISAYEGEDVLPRREVRRGHRGEPGLLPL